MKLFRKTKKIEDVSTDCGNDLLSRLAEEGWKTISEYSDQMFDKGIDYDAYTLKKGQLKLEFTWSNWDEWTIEGDATLLESLSEYLVSTGNQTGEQDSTHQSATRCVV